MRLLRLAIPLVFIVAACATYAQQPKAKVTGIYSNMAYNQEGGDVLGIEIFVLYTRQGYHVVFQTAEGEPSVPAVIRASIDGTKIAFSLPPSIDPRGMFQGQITENELVGTFAGNNQQIRLKRKASYWQ
jgi:hypothetical protein